MRTLKEALPGDCVEFKREGKWNSADFYLARLLKWFRPKWDMWGWHVAPITEYQPGTGWMILDTNMKGVNEVPLSNYKDKEFRVWRWLDEPPSPSKMAEYVFKHTGEKYDVMIYPFTLLWAICREKFGFEIPRILDKKWSCWETVTWMWLRMGKELIPEADYPLLSDITSKCTLVREVPMTPANWMNLIGLILLFIGQCWTWYVFNHKAHQEADARKLADALFREDIKKAVKSVKEGIDDSEYGLRALNTKMGEFRENCGKSMSTVTATLKEHERRLNTKS